MTDKERLNAAYYGIHVNDGGNTAKIRLGAGDAVAATQPDASIAAAFGNRFSTDPMWSLTTHTVRNVVQRGGQPALYCLNSAPARGFVREDLLIVPHGTELPPDQVLMRARPQLTR